jgi:hypothetical protein
MEDTEKSERDLSLIICHLKLVISEMANDNLPNTNVKSSPDFSVRSVPPWWNSSLTFSVVRWPDADNLAGA